MLDNESARILTNNQLSLSNNLRKRPRVSLRVVLIWLALHPAGWAATIIFAGGELEVVSHRSDGAELAPDSGFVFEIGTFYGDFQPTAENTDDWLSNWAPIADGAGAPLPGATTPYATVTTIFGDEYHGFSSSVELTHNNDPFTAGKQGFIWGFDNRSVSGGGEWILLANAAEWKIPTGTGIVFSQTWIVSDANSGEVLVGSVDGASMTLGSVSVPGAPVPEPAAAALFAGTLALLAIRRPGRR